MTGTGAARLAADLREVGERLADTRAVEDQAAAVIAADATRRAPRRTGRLASSVAAAGGRVNVAAPYAPYVEYGTRRTRAQPFLAPAVESAPWLDPYRDHLDNVLDVVRSAY